MAIARVNNTSGDHADTPATSITTTALNCVAGNFLVVALVQSASASRTISTISDTAGNTYHWGPPTRLSNGAVIGTMQLAYAYNILGNASNQVTITLDLLTNNTIVAIVAQYSGVKTSADPYDTEGSAGTGTGSATTGSFTPSAAGELVFSAGGIANSTGGFSAGSGFSILQSYDYTTGGICTAVQDIINSSGSAQTANMTSSHTGTDMAIVAAVFKADVGGGGGGGGGHTALTLLGVG